MKKMFLFMVFLLSLTAISVQAKVTTDKNDDAKFVQVVDVGTPTVAIINLDTFDGITTHVPAQVQPNHEKTAISAIYQEPTEQVYDMAIGLNRTELITQINTLKKALTDKNIELNLLSEKYDILYFHVNGVLPTDSTIRLCN